MLHTIERRSLLIVAAAIAGMFILGAAFIGPGRADDGSTPDPCFTETAETNAADAVGGDEEVSTETDVVLVVDPTQSSISDPTRQDMVEGNAEAAMEPDAGELVHLLAIAVNDDAYRDPSVLARISLTATGEGKDNPTNQSRALSSGLAQARACVLPALSAPSDAHGSDIVGAMRLGVEVAERDTVRVVYVGDGLVHTPSCDLAVEPLDEADIDGVVAACIGGPPSGRFEGIVFDLYGLGISDDGPDHDRLVAFWTLLIEAEGGTVDDTPPLAL